MNGAVKQASYSYDQYNNVTDEKDYDWGNGGPGSLLREIQTSYVTNPSYIGLNMVGLPQLTQVLNGSGDRGGPNAFRL